MSNSNEFKKVLDTILSIPGMGETVKIDFRISRKNALLLSNVIKQGLVAGEGEASGLLASVSKEDREELSAIADDCLQKAGLTELSEKLKAFGK